MGKMDDFEERLSALCSKAMADAKDDPDAMGVIIERLLHSAAFSIAIAARGNAEGIQTFLHGAETYLYETAAQHAPLGKMMAASPSGK